jgi:hypothetical protein
MKKRELFWAAISALKGDILECAGLEHEDEYGPFTRNCRLATKVLRVMGQSVPVGKDDAGYFARGEQTCFMQAILAAVYAAQKQAEKER